jgi:hypothetical protein
LFVGVIASTLIRVVSPVALAALCTNATMQ